MRLQNSCRNGTLSHACRKSAARAIIAFTALRLLSNDAFSQDLRTTVEWLSSPERDGRRAGSAGGRAAADYIAERFKELGLETRVQDFGTDRRNVIAQLGSEAPFLIVGAHYDGQGPGLPSASDNAAGVAVMLDIAAALKARPPRTSVVFIAFDDEEQGLIGSRYYTDHPLFPLDQTRAAVIFDTMGRSFLDLPETALMILGTEYSPDLAAVVRKRLSARVLNVGSDLIGPRSDFAPFAVKRIPYLFFTHATHRDYHGADDTASRLDFETLASDSALIGEVIREVANLDQKPEFRDEASYPPGEAQGLIRQMMQVEGARTSLPAVYKLLFADLRLRLEGTPSRDDLRLATTVLLAAATPRLSAFQHQFFIAPAYEREKKPSLAVASYEEALAWTTDEAVRQRLRDKISALSKR